ncbi:hypothetical protein [Rubinisphaera italica]|uniref:Uncharacterized protein n=1 Tax=Rubinisphaera italica TaxID=2527969 RepID=A0A5C5XIA6_9PLAN|nr:hypothetical protein [Rubinisphaera italica]TWT62867.1 hypothetical protein Pan54_36130 [Rubinisphaera italica]
MSKRLEKLNIDNKISWYFVNEQGGTTRYRELQYPFPDLRCFDLGDGTEFESLERFEWQRIRELGEELHIDPNSIKKENLIQWVRFVLQHESPILKKMIVPTTAIRKLYEFMRGEFKDREFRSKLLDALSEAPESLIELCRVSYAQFVSYDNQSEGWGSSVRKKLPEAPVNLSDSSKTNEVVSYFTKVGATCLSNAGFSYVTREFNPRRTTNGVFESGLSARSSGAGGIDVLLMKNGNPVVGEIKVKDDADPFYALIQCLTYAIEAGTPNQFLRMKKYPIDQQPEFFELDEQSPNVDICIICINHSHVEMYKRLSVLVKKLEESGDLPFLGKIYLTHNSGNDLKHFEK